MTGKLTETTAEKYFWEICARCERFREATVNRRSGRYLVTIPRMCGQKDDCEVELLNRAGFSGIIKDLAGLSALKGEQE